MADERKIGTVEIDRLYDFLDGLQASGYTIDPRQYLALSDLLMAFIARGYSLGELPLKTLIAPLICATPAEQQDFYQRFDRWYPTLLPVKQASLSGDGITLPPSPKRRWFLPTIKRTTVIWVTVVVAVIALIVWLISNSAATGTQVINSTLSLYGAIFAVIGFMVWLGWRASILYQENQYITRELANQEPVYTKVPVKAYIQDVMPVMQFKPIVSTLRKRTQVPSAEVDVDRTIENALNRSNWLEIVYRQHQVMPEYVVLIDRKSRLDQQARFVQEVLAKLEADGVWLHQYEFSGDPRICFPLDRKDTPLRLKDLQARHPDSRLLIFSGIHELINPLTGLLQDWLEFLTYWHERAILTPDKMQKVLLEELEAQDFAVLPMTFDGLASLVRAFEADNTHLLTNGGASLPTQLTERPMRWTGRDMPPEAEVKTLVDDLKNYLGENVFYWLCATAVYPELRWELTLHLGSALSDDSGNSLLNPDRLIRLARLPWFRFGYMPDWIRLTLINNFPSIQEKITRNILSELISSVYQGEDFHLIFSRNKSNYLTQTKRLLNALFRVMPAENIMQDQIFIKFITGHSTRKLSITITEEFRNRFLQIRKRILLTPATFVAVLSRLFSQFKDAYVAIARNRSSSFEKKTIKTNPRHLNVFLVHAMEDKVAVRSLYKKLTSYDWITVWFDEENLLGGQDWDYTISKSLQSSDVIIVCVSKILSKRPGLVQREIRRALDISYEKPDDRSFVVPVLLEEAQPPTSLRRFESFNIYEKGGFEELVKLLQSELDTVKSYNEHIDYREVSYPVQLNRPLKIFISYSMSDRNEVLALSSRLTNDGNEVYLMDGEASFTRRGEYNPDTDWRLVTARKIEESDIVIACLSKNYVSRGDYAPRFELRLAQDLLRPENEIFIIPLRLEDCEILDVLRKYHYIDFYKNDGYEKLTKSLEARRGQLARIEVLNNNIAINKGTAESATSIINDMDLDILNLKDIPRLRFDQPFRVFLYYSNQPKNPASANEESQVYKIYKILEKQGMEPWMDREKLLPGMEWNKEMKKAVDSSHAILFFISKRTFDEAGIVDPIIKYILDRSLDEPEGNIFIIPVKLEECSTPFRLENYTEVHLYEKNGSERIMQSLYVRAEQIGVLSPENKRKSTPDIPKIMPRKQAAFQKDTGSIINISGNVTDGNLVIGDENNTNVKINFDPELLNYNELMDLPDDQFDEVQVFKLAKLFEIDLRRLITKEFNQRLGWWEKGIPVEVAKKLSKQQTESSNLLEFTTLGDLFRIIQFKENWDIVFEPIFSGIRNFNQAAGVIVSGRNRIAYLNTMSQDEFRNFAAAAKLVLKQIRSYLSGETESEQKKRLQETKNNLLEKNDVKTLGKAIREAEILMMRNMADEELLQLHQNGKMVWDQLHEEHNRATTKTHIVILEDHKSIVEGYLLRLAAEPKIEVVETVAYAEELIPILEVSPIDLLIMDFNHPTSAANKIASPTLTFIRFLKEKFPDLEILVITMMSGVSFIESILDAGASGYINKADNKSIKNLAQIILKVKDGDLYLSDKVYDELRLSKSETGLLLSDRQIEVLSLCASYPDKSTSELAGMMGVANSTFRNMLSIAYLRLQVRTRVAAISRAKQLGLIPSKLSDQGLADEIDKPMQMAKYTVGQQIKVKITRLVDFGAFAEIESGLEGLIRASKMAWGEVDDVSKFVKVGEIIDVSVEKIDLVKQQIGLSMLKAEDDPFNKYKIGQRIKGKINKIIPAGLIVELESGVSGLVHISQISRDFITPEKLQEDFKIGESVTVLIIGVEEDKRKISLSIKQA